MPFGNNGNTVLLVPCDGTDASTIIPDTSQAGNGGSTHGNATVAGNAQLDTAAKKWGTASLLLDGTGDYISYADHADWDILSQTDVTIDLQVKFDLHDAEETFVAQYEDGANNWVFYHAHEASGNYGLRFLVYSGGAQIIDTGWTGPNGGEITDTNWHHVAMCKVGNAYGIYLDGTQVGYVSDTDTDTFAGSLYIGAYGTGGAQLDGQMDEVRIQLDNWFGAAPNSTPDDTIVVPTAAYSKVKVAGLTSWAKISGIRNVGKIAGHGDG